MRVAAQAVGHIGEIQVGMADQVLVQPVGLSANAAGVRAETGQIRQPELNTVVRLPSRGRASAGPACGMGACCRIRCALVPLIPNEDTAAVRG